MQPDSIIPDLSNPQSWNRFSYVTNRPIGLNDPTGHMMDDGCNTTGCDGSKYSDIQVLLNLGKDAKNEKSRRHYYNKAMNKVQDEFGIDIPDGYDFVYGGVDPLDPEGDFAITDLTVSNDLNILDPAFATTAGDLAATMAHEACHVNQYEGTSCLASPQTTGKRYSFSGIGHSMNEIEAREKVLLNLQHFGEGLTYGIKEAKIEQYNDNIRELTKDYRFNADFMGALENKIYILPYGF